MLRTLAGDHALKLSLDHALDTLALPHLDQANESDVNLLTQLGKRFDAIATIKAGTLIFKPIDATRTDAGMDLPALQLIRASGDSHRHSVADRDVVTGVRAYWGDRDAARRKGVLVRTDKNEKKLQATYATEAEARQNAKAELQRLQRGMTTLSMRLALGRADLYPDVKLSISGFKPEIDGTDWLVAKATRMIAGSLGFATSLELERSL